MCENFYNHALKKFDECFPLSRKSRKRSKVKKWITSDLRNSIQKKHFLYKKQLKSPSEKNRMDYIVYKNILSTCLKDAENSYHINLVNEKQSGTTNFWKAYAAKLNPKKRKQQTKLQKLIVEGKTLTDDKDIADGINNYFCTIGSKISYKIKSPGGHFTDYLKNKINNTFFISPVVEAEVSRELAKLNPKKAFGPDNITIKIVTSCASQLSAPLTRIYNRGLNEACFPGVWKLAKVVALYIKKYHFLPENYRPISLLNCFGIFFKKLISKQVVLFIEKYKILYIYKYGFRRRHSTSLALI